uniref:Uncharacterized protein n=1 Tax=Xiphophorus couchianus TaxID=32473 RepID=A0A3B5MN71_9TELE
MNLWLGSLLFASLLLIGSALSPEECRPLVAPVSLADPSVKPFTMFQLVVNIESGMIILCFFHFSLCLFPDLNMTAVSHVLPSCDGCLVLMINSTAKNIEILLQLFKLGNANIQNEVTARSLYFLGSAVSESDMERFKKQASCLGFSGEPNFLHKPEKSFCKEEESIHLPDSF